MTHISHCFSKYLPASLYLPERSINLSISSRKSIEPGCCIQRIKALWTWSSLENIYSHNFFKSFRTHESRYMPDWDCTEDHPSLCDISLFRTADTTAPRQNITFHLAHAFVFYGESPYSWNVWLPNNGLFQHLNNWVRSS